MTRAADAVESALVGGQAAQARRKLADVRDPDDRDGVLALLARHASGGSPLATELLIEAVDGFDVARRAVRRFLFDERAVDDVTQDTLISVAQSIGSFRGESSFTTWLHRLARNRAVDHLRRARATEPLDDQQVSLAARMSSLIASRETVRQLLDELPAHYRDAVLLREVGRLSYDEVAARLSLNVNTVKSHVARGRAVLASRVHDGTRKVSP